MLFNIKLQCFGANRRSNENSNKGETSENVER